MPIHDLDHLKSLSPLENIPRLCFPASSMLIVTLTMHHHRQPYSRLICRPYAACFSWPASFRESSVSEGRWNTGHLVSKLCSDYSAPSSYSILASHVPRYPQSLSSGGLATPTSTPDPTSTTAQRSRSLFGGAPPLSSPFQLEIGMMSRFSDRTASNDESSLACTASCRTGWCESLTHEAGNHLCLLSTDQVLVNIRFLAATDQ